MKGTDFPDTVFPLWRSLRPDASLAANLHATALLLFAWSIYSLWNTQALEWYTMLPGGLTLAAAFLLHGPLRRLGNRIWFGLALFTLVAVLAEFLLLGPAFFFDAVLHLVFFLLLNRFVTAERPRDFAQLYLLALLPILGATALTVALSFVLSSLVFAFLSLAYLMMLASYANMPPSQAWQERGLIGGGFLRLVAIALGGLVVISSLLFVVIPRASFAALFSNLEIRPPGAESLSGFSNEIRWGQTERIKLNFAKAFFVEVPEGYDPGPLPYWRVLALDQYKASGWQVSEGARLEEDSWRIPRAGMFPPTVYHKLTVFMEPRITTYLVTVKDHAAIQGPREESVKINRLMGTLELRVPKSDIYSYHLYVRNLRKRHAIPPSETLTPREKALFLQMPYDSGQVARLEEVTRTIAGIGATPEETAQRIQSHLRTRFAYSLDIAPSGEDDPLLHFLTRSRSGHCEFFAGAMVMMLRGRGIPARIVTGYAGGDLDGSGTCYTVRQSDAHAWVEAWFEGRGWQTFDPTPASSFNRNQALWDRVRRQVAAVTDRMAFLWYQNVVNYTLADQLGFLRNAGHARNRLFQSALNFHLPDLASLLKGRRSGSSGTFTPVLAILLVAGGGVTLFVLLRRRRRTGTGMATGAAATRLWMNALEGLRSRRLAPLPGETAMEFSTRAAPALPCGDLLQSIVRRYYLLRFGNEESPEELGLLRKEVDILRRELRRRRSSHGPRPPSA